jgi:hypothetical protein
MPFTFSHADYTLPDRFPFPVPVSRSHAISPLSHTGFPLSDRFLSSMPFTLSLASSLGRYVFGSEISYNKPPPRLPGLGC